MWQSWCNSREGKPGLDRRSPGLPTIYYGYTPTQTPEHNLQIAVRSRSLAKHRAQTIRLNFHGFRSAHIRTF